MRSAHPYVVAGLLLGAILTAGCGSDSGGLDWDTGGFADTGRPPGRAPTACAGQGWGIVSPQLAPVSVHVSPEGDDGGDGTVAHPFATLDAALAATRAEGGWRTIMVWAGTYTASLDLASSLGDDGLHIVGCGSDVVKITGASDEAPVLRVSEGQGVVVTGLTLAGGRRAVLAWQGADLELTDVVATDNGRGGILIDGAATAAALHRVSVRDPRPDPLLGAYGLAVQGASVTASDLEIAGAGTVGILIDGSSSVVEIRNASVRDTQPDESGRYGRGVHAQALATLRLTDVVIADNHDAGLFSSGAALVALTNVTVGGTLPSPVGQGDDEAADGIVVTDGEPDEDYSKPYLGAVFTNVNVDAPGRAGVLVAGNGVAADVAGGVSIGNAGYDPGDGAVLAQDGAIVSGGPVFVLGEKEQLVFAAAELELSEP